MRVWMVLVLVCVLGVAGIAIYYLLGAPVTHQPGKDMHRLTKEAVPTHLASLKSSDALEREKAARAIWLIGTFAKEATPALLEAATDKEPRVRAEVARALGRTSQGGLDAVPALTAMLQDDQAAIRAAAAGSLAEIWSMQDQDREKLSPAAAAAPTAIKFLMRNLADSDPLVRGLSSKALAEAGAGAVPATEALAALLTDKEQEVRLQAALALINVGPGAQAAVPALLLMLEKDPDDGLRGTAARALGSIHAQPETVISALVQAYVREQQNDTKGMIAMGLAGFGAASRNALPFLEAALADPKYKDEPVALQSIQRIVREINRRMPEKK